MRGPRRVTVFVRSSEITVGTAAGRTFAWTGENAAASSNAIQRSEGASVVKPATVAATT